MAKAKTGSKNSLANRGAKVSYFFNNKEVTPSWFIDFEGNTKFLCVQEKASGDLIFDLSGSPLSWKEAKLEKR